MNLPDRYDPVGFHFNWPCKGSSEDQVWKLCAGCVDKAVGVALREFAALRYIIREGITLKTPVLSGHTMYALGNSFLFKVGSPLCDVPKALGDHNFGWQRIKCLGDVSASQWQRDKTSPQT